MRFCSLFATTIILSSASCGGKKDSPSNPPPRPADPAFLLVKPVIDQNCGPCHNGLNQREFTEQNFKDSKAKTRIENGSMPPPPRTLSEEDKKTLLGYL